MLGWAIALGLGAAAAARGFSPKKPDADGKPASKPKKRETVAEAYARGLKEAGSKSDAEAKAKAAEQKKIDAAVSRALKAERAKQSSNEPDNEGDDE